MALWTFMTLVGNGKRVYVDQVRANDFRSALKAWHRIVDIEGMTDEARERMSSEEPPDDAVTEFARQWRSGVWTFGSDFGRNEHEFPEEWGYKAPAVWVIKTDNSPLTQGELF
jgi:ribosomal protein S21